MLDSRTLVQIGDYACNFVKWKKLVCNDTSSMTSNLKISNILCIFLMKDSRNGNDAYLWIVRLSVILIFIVFLYYPLPNEAPLPHTTFIVRKVIK